MSAPGALRAAKRIGKLAGFPPIMDDALAEMIDHETGVKELVEALEKLTGLYTWFISDANHEGVTFDQAYYTFFKHAHDEWKQAIAALAKHKGEHA